VWLRDATFTVQAFLETGYVDEAAAWRNWLVDATAGAPDIQLMYGVDGSRDLPEMTLDWLPGHAGSSPVRVGNAASSQQQNDVWGEVLHALTEASEAGMSDAAGDEELHDALLAHLIRSWKRPDHGLWEVRGPRRHFLHSKVMAWVGVDRAIRGNRFRARTEQAELRALRAAIRDDVITNGFNSARGAFTQSYGSDRLDAAALLLPRYGFLPWSDPRILQTIDAIQSDLTSDGLVLRYSTHDGINADGLVGGEGTFLACSFWLADALHETGRTGEAQTLFERLLSLRNDVGLLSEQYDPVSGRQLGNIPQSFSHAGIVTTAIRLARQPVAVPQLEAA
jgi:GH15 family glucan-1,4-alpha-glucosidase